MKRETRVLCLSLACFALAPSQALAQEAPDRQEAPDDRFMLEAGISGGYDCPGPPVDINLGMYFGINGRVAGPLSLYGMVEKTQRCAGVVSVYRFGASVLLGRSSWLARPALRGGVDYDGDEAFATAGASLTFGRRYGARFIVHIEECGNAICDRLQMGGYVSF